MIDRNQQIALDRFAVEVSTTLKAVEDWFWRPKDDSSLPPLKPFTALVHSYEAILAVGGEIDLQDLGTNTNFRHVSVPAPWGIITFNDLGSILSKYYKIPETQRSSALERADELLILKPGASLIAYQLIWNSTLPVRWISSNRYVVNSKQPYMYWVSPFEIEAFGRSHDTADWVTYGYDVLMLLNSNQLKEAVNKFEKLNPSGAIKELSSMAGFKSASMTPEILLKALTLGYSSVEHLRNAGKHLGVSTRSKDFFKEVFEAGANLADQTKSLS